MPDSKLVEKLGFSLDTVRRQVLWLDDEQHIRQITEADPSTCALWNLCLEQEKLLELYRAKRASDGAGREWHAGKHLAAEEAIAVAEKEKKA